MYINKVFHRYFAFVMIVSVLGLSTEYSPAFNNYLKDSYVSVINSLDLIIMDSKGEQLSDKVSKTVMKPVKIEMKGSNFYVKKGEKNIKAFSLVLSGENFVIENLKLKQEGGDEIISTVSLVDGTGKVLGEGEKEKEYWKFKNINFNSGEISIQMNLNENIFSGERVRFILEKKGIVLDKALAEAKFPLKSGYLTIVGKY